MWVIFFIAFMSLLFIALVIAWLQGLRYTIYSAETSSPWFLSSSFVFKYFFIRIIFLIVYEIWFRGFLLTDSINYFGIPVAIAINTFLYTLLNVFAGRKDLSTRIFFGIFLCCLSIWFAAAWPAIISHLAIAITYEATILKRFFLVVKVPA